MTPIPGHFYQLHQNPYPERVYRCDSVANGQVNLTIVRRDPSETLPDIAITDYRFAVMATEVPEP